MCKFFPLHLQCVKIELAKSSLRKESALKKLSQIPFQKIHYRLQAYTLCK